MTNIDEMKIQKTSYMKVMKINENEERNHDILMKY